MAKTKKEKRQKAAMKIKAFLKENPQAATGLVRVELGKKGTKVSGSQIYRAKSKLSGKKKKKSKAKRK